MAPQIDDRTLRSVNYRLKNTPVHQLPRIIGPITSQLVSSECHVSGSSSEITWLKTRISSLQRDRSPEARFSAVVLIKTLLDLGGLAIVTDDKERIGAWIRGLLDVLKRPDPTATKNCAIVTLTRAFMLTWENATLVRELTTPVLPTFITTCLQQVQGASQSKTPVQNELIEFVLESFAQLLPRHPTVFRSFASQIRNLAIATLCSDPFDDNETPDAVSSSSSEVKDAACHVLVLLHQCAQKGGGAAEWEKGLDELLVASHVSLDHVFRAVTEDWQSTAGVRSTIVASEELPHEPYVEQADQRTGFPGWHGLRSGVERVQALLSLLQTYIYTPTATSVKIPLGRIVDLLTRLLYVQVPRLKDPVGTRFNVQIGREEREELMALLPAIHVSALEVISTLLARLEGTSLSVGAHLMDLIVWLFQAEQFNADIRMAVYRCTAQLLVFMGPTLGKASTKSLDKIARSCCADILPAKREAQAHSSEVINAQLTNGAKAGKGPNTTANQSLIAQRSPAETLPGLYDAAHDLLPVLFNKLPTELVAKATRTEMDRTAILTNHIEALAASVVNPAPQKPSLLPFLSALAPESLVTEAILRPRMPVVLTGRQDGGVDVEAEDRITNDQEDGEQEDALEMVETNDEEGIHQPKIMDWTSVSRRQPQEPSSSTAFGDITSTSMQDAQKPLPTSDLGSKNAGKRAVNHELEEISTIGVKRARITNESMPAATVVSVLEGVVPQAEAPSVQLATDTAAEAAMAEQSDDDEDGSDFEMPKLVFKSDVADDEDVDEEEQE